MNQSFKEYLQSKEILVEALSKTAKTNNRYILKTYCKLPVYDGDDKLEISLKPKSEIIVECTWPTYNEPLVHNIKFSNVVGVDSNKSFIVSWKNEKILRWLDKNAKVDSWLSKINSQLDKDDDKNNE